MAQSIDIEVDDRGIRKLLLNLQKRMKDMTPVFREIGEIILESVQNNIREGESPDGVNPGRSRSGRRSRAGRRSWTPGRIFTTA